LPLFTAITTAVTSHLFKEKGFLRNNLMKKREKREDVLSKTNNNLPAPELVN